MDDRTRQNGFALVTVMLLLALIMSLLLAYHTLTRGEMTSTKASLDSARGFYAAEAGINRPFSESRARSAGRFRTTFAVMPGSTLTEDGLSKAKVAR